MIEVTGIKKKYGRHQVLKDISFTVNTGERVVIAGMNGCGKSTLLQIMAGVLKADAGSILYFGQNAVSNSRICRDFIGYVPQENPLLEELTVRDNLRLWKYRDDSVKEKIEQQFELEEIMSKKVKELSGGMKRRLSIACSLTKWPPILLLDEPTTALDLYYREGINKLVCDYCGQGGIAIITSHDESEILSADRCLFMQDGKITDMGKINDISIILRSIRNEKEN